MKKINPKITKLALMLMTLLIAGGTAIAIKEGHGDPVLEGGGTGDGGT